MYKKLPDQAFFRVAVYLIVALSLVHASLVHVFVGVYISPLRFIVLNGLLFFVILLFLGQKVKRLSASFFVFYLIFLISLAVSAYLGADYNVDYRVIAFYAFGASIALLVGLYLVEGGRCGEIASIFLVITVVLLLIASVEIFMGFHLPSSKLHGESHEAWLAASATYFNQNDFSYALVVSLAVMIPFFLQSSGGLLVRILVAIVFAWSVCVFFVNNSNAALICSILYFVLVLALFLDQFLRKFSAGVVAVLLSLPVFGVLYVGLAIFGVYDYFQNLQLLGASGGSVTVRANMVVCSFEELMERTGFGVGPGNSELAMADCRHYTGGVVNPHSFLVEAFLELGVFFVLFVVAVFSVFLFTSLKTYSEKSRLLRQFCMSPVTYISIAIVVGSLGPSSAIGMPLHWVAIGLLLGFLFRGWRTDQQGIGNSRNFRGVFLRKKSAVVSGVCTNA